MGTTASPTAPSSTATGTSAPATSLVEDGRIVAVGRWFRDRRRPRLDHRVEVVDLAGGLLSPGFIDAHVHPIQGGLERLRCDLSEHATREEYLAAIRAYADRAPRPWSGSSAAAGRCRPSRAARRPRPTSTRSCPTGRCSCPTATTTAPGSTAGRWRSPASTASTPDPPDGRIERDADGRPTGTLHEGATALVSRHLPAHHRRGLLRRRCSRASATCTRSASPAWQDAIVGAYSGMDDPGADVRRRPPRNGDLPLARRRRAVVGARPRRRAGRRPGRAPRARCTDGRFRATSVKIMQDGVAENGTAAMLDALPRPLRPRDRQPRPLVRRGRRAARGGRARSTPRASRCTCTRIGDRGVARGARRVRGHRPGPPPPHRAPPARAPRRRAPLRRASASPPTCRRCGPASTSR